jgi:hypothetical protein
MQRDAGWLGRLQAVRAPDIEDSIVFGPQETLHDTEADLPQRCQRPQKAHPAADHLPFGFRLLLDDRYRPEARNEAIDHDVGQRTTRGEHHHAAFTNSPLSRWTHFDTA